MSRFHGLNKLSKMNWEELNIAHFQPIVDCGWVLSRLATGDRLMFTPYLTQSEFDGPRPRWNGSSFGSRSSKLGQLGVMGMELIDPNLVPSQSTYYLLIV